MLVFSVVLNAQNISLVQFSTGYSAPVAIENCGDSRLFIVEQQGKIFICDALGNRKPQPLLDITDRVLFEGERGLLGLAFDPGFKLNRYFYVYYINKSGNTQVSRFRTMQGKPQANSATEKKIISIIQPFSNHNGGCIRFGKDGYLYIGMGDGGSGGDPNNNAQNTMSLLGKMLRIDVRTKDAYKIPANNPFVDSVNYKPEIWDLGLRNPWRWSFDALDGSLYIADVGQGAWEEIDVEQTGNGGKNYGWRCYEGNHAYNTSGCKPQAQYNTPVYEYAHATSIGDCSITGGFVYRGSKYSSLYGKYIFTDYCSGFFRLLYKQAGSYVVTAALDGDNNAYTSFGVDKNNEMYVTNISNGNIYRITDGATQQNSIASKNPVENSLSFSPNPSRGNINILYNAIKSEPVTLSITSVLGKRIFSTSRLVNAGNNNWNINVQVPHGNYYLSIVTKAGNVITKSLQIE